MKKHLKQSKISIISILCVSILIIGISTYSSMRINATTLPSNSQSYSSLTPHDPIYIDADSDFEVFPGSGTAENPFIIEGYNITTTGINGIYITETTKYFTIRNCYVDALNYGIYIRYVDYGTAIILNNTCENNENHGIYLENSGSTVENNTCSNNNRYGVLLYYSGSSNVTDNTCNNNGWDGIDMLYSGSSNVTNNTCSNNNNGISLDNSGSSNVTDNTCYNKWNGIVLYDSDSCVVTYNLLQENEEYGIKIYSNCDNNIIHHNNFVDNNLSGTSQGDDDGTNNLWYDSVALEGNYWDDWLGSGTYSIDGSAGSEDKYPLDEPVVEIEPPLIVNIIHSPSTPTDLDSISINATVTDASGIHNVTLHYKINGGTWTEISMTLISGDIYSVTIGPFAVSDTIEYYVSAIDNSANNNEAINDNSGLYYSFTVSVVIPEFQMFSPLLPTITFLFLVFGLVALQRRKK